MKEFFVCHVFSKLICDSGQVFEGDMVFVLREQDESFFKLCLIVSLRHLGYHYVQEIAIVNKNNSLLILIVPTSLRIVIKILD